MIDPTVGAPTTGTGDTTAGDTITGIIMMIVIIMVDLMVRPGDEDTAIKRRSVSDNVSKKAGERSSAFFVPAPLDGFEEAIGSLCLEKR